MILLLIYHSFLIAQLYVLNPVQQITYLRAHLSGRSACAAAVAHSNRSFAAINSYLRGRETVIMDGYLEGVKNAVLWLGGIAPTLYYYPADLFTVLLPYR